MAAHRPLLFLAAPPHVSHVSTGYLLLALLLQVHAWTRGLATGEQSQAPGPMQGLQ